MPHSSKMRLFFQVWSSLHPIPYVTTTLCSIGMVNLALHQAKTRIFMGGKSIGRCSPPNKVTKSPLSRRKFQKRARKCGFSGKKYVSKKLLSKKILCRPKLHIFGIVRPRAFRWCPTFEKKVGPKGAYQQKREKRVLKTVFSKKSQSNFFSFSISKYGSRDTV